eukprot:8248713-Pyramimonas_sp.AAC.2
MAGMFCAQAHLCSAGPMRLAVLVCPWPAECTLIPLVLIVWGHKSAAYGCSCATGSRHLGVRARFSGSI